MKNKSVVGVCVYPQNRSDILVIARQAHLNHSTMYALSIINCKIRHTCMQGE